MTQCAELWHLRDARRYIAGQVCSDAGNFVLFLATGVWVKMLTGSTSDAALTLFALALGGLAGPLGGLLVDRVRRKPLLITANLATAVLVSALLFVHSADRLWLIYLVMFGYGLSGAVITPAQTALMQRVVPDHLLSEANGVLATVGQGMRLVAPLLGTGVLVTFGPAPLILGDMATFALAVLSLLSIDVVETRPSPTGERWTAEALAGLNHLCHDRDLHRLTCAAVVVLVTFGLAETGVLAVVWTGLHRPVGFIAVAVTVQGIGAVLVGPFAGSAVRRWGESRTVGVALLLVAISYVLLASPGLASVLCGSAFLGAGLPLFGVGTSTLLQRRTPPELMGRTSAAYNLVISIPQTISIAAGAGLFAALDFRLLFALMAVAAAVPALGLIRTASKVREALQAKVTTPPEAPAG
jgi:MFS family permease